MTSTRGTWEPNGAAIDGYASAEIHHIPLNRLKFPYQSDEATSEHKIMENVRKMKACEALGPVIVGMDHDVLDGHHKIEAAKRMGYTHAPCCVTLGANDFSRAAANARYRGMWDGSRYLTFERLRGMNLADPNLSKSMPLLHATHPEAAETIKTDGFRAGTDGHDFGVAVYFKSPELDKLEDNEITETDPVLRRFESGAVVEAGLKRGAKILDLSDPRNKEVARLLKLLAASWNPQLGSPYEYYAKQKGYDAIIGEIPNKPDEGWVISVFNPDKLKVKRENVLSDVLEKSLGKTKKMHGDLPPGGRWVTIRGNHVYIKNGKVLAGGIPGVLGNGDKIVKKMSKADIKLHQQYHDAKEGKKKAKAAQPAPAKPTKGPQYHAFHVGVGYKPVKGTKVDAVDGFHTFHHTVKGEHFINEAKSGTVLGRGKSKEDAIKMAQDHVKSYGTKYLQDAISAHAKKHGASPTMLDKAAHEQDNKGKDKPAKEGGKPSAKGKQSAKPTKPTAKKAGHSDGGTGGTGGKGTKGAVGQGGQDAGGNRPPDSEFSVKGAKVVKHIPEHGMYEVTGHKAFHKAITEAKAAHAEGHGAMVHAYEPDEYKEKRLFLNKDGTHGFALSKDGDIVSVFKHPTKGQKGALAHIMMTAIKNGGNRLDAFGGGLQDMYAKFGFEAKAQLPFDDEYAPEGWNYDKLGRPPVVFMKHNGDSPEKIASSSYGPIDMSKVPVASDYDDAVAIQQGQKPQPIPVQVGKDPRTLATAEVKPAMADMKPEDPEKIPASLKLPEGQRDSRIEGDGYGQNPAFMKTKGKGVTDEVRETYKDKAYVPGGYPKSAEPVMREALKLAKQSPDVREFSKNLTRDIARVFSSGKISEAHFYAHNHEDEDRLRKHASQHIPTVKNKDAEKATNAMKEQLHSAHGGSEGEYYVYHGTSVPKVSHILEHGFGVNGGAHDFGNAVYMKSPVYDQYDHADLSAEETAKLINNFAEQAGSPAVIKCKVTGGKILDCKRDGRPAELDTMVKNWGGAISGHRVTRGKMRSVLHYEGKISGDDSQNMSDDEIKAAMKEHYGAETDKEIGTLLSNTSPYELYAKHHGYDMVVDKLDDFKEEGWQIGVYNPKVLQVVDVGRKVSGSGAKMKLEKSLNTDAAETPKKQGKREPHCLLHFGYEDGEMHVYVGAQDDRGGNGPQKGDKLEKSLIIRIPRRSTR